METKNIIIILVIAIAVFVAGGATYWAVFDRNSTGSEQLNKQIGENRGIIEDIRSTNKNLEINNRELENQLELSASRAAEALGLVESVGGENSSSLGLVRGLISDLEKIRGLVESISTTK